MNEKNKSILALSIFGVIILLLILLQIFRKDELLKYKSKTTGKIIDFHFSNNAYSIKYSFEVDNKKYEGYRTVRYFKCDDGIEGCVGKKFTVYFSTKNPNNNEIDLGKYNSKKFKKITFN